MSLIKKNLLQVRREIANAIRQEKERNIEHYKPNIIAVTKYFDKSKIIEAYEAGLRDFGESKVIEAIKKIEELPDSVKENSKFHLIGHLQTNKVGKAVENFDIIHSIDSLKLAKIVSQEAIKRKKIQDVLIQVNNANEIQKFGFSKEELFKSFKEINNLKGLKVIGLMNMAPLGLNKKELRELFKEVIKIRDELEKKFDCELKEISMGMSGDYLEAILEGATMIRLGRKLFS